jgi:AraC-like DNA-binding protein
VETSVQTRNIDEAVEAVSRLLVPHSIKVMNTRERIDARLQVRQPTSQPLISLSYGAPVTVYAGEFSGLFLVKHCLRGAAQATQGRRQGEWREGQTVLLSAGVDTQLRFDQACVQQSLRLDPARMEQLCARLLGYPLESSLRFDLRPFSAELEQVWRRTLAYLYPGDGRALLLTAAAQASLDEFLLTLLLHQHRHNYSEELTEPVPTPVPGIVRRAERYMQDHSETPLVISEVAAELGVSVRTLQAAFREWRNTTPQLLLREIRLQRVREGLLAGGETSVTDTALRFGFSHLGRFSAYYEAKFGERPSVTLRRSSRRAQWQIANKGL